jgi:Zn-dependent metalloprotease
MKTFLRASGCSVLVLLLAGSMALAQRPEPPHPGLSPSAWPALIDRLQEEAGGAIRVSYHAGTGQVRFVGAEPGQPIGSVRAADSSPEMAARDFLRAYGTLFGLHDQATELVLMRSRAAQWGGTVVRFQQVVGAVPVLGGELIVQLDSHNQVLSAIGEILPDVALETVPQANAEMARRQALEVVAKRYNLDPGDLNTTEPELWIYNPVLLGGPGRPTDTLVWRIEVNPVDVLPIRELVLVDALQGHVPLHFNQIGTSLYRLIYDNSNDPNAGLPGPTLVRYEGGAATGIADADNAYDYTGFTYDFYSTRYGRDSIDDGGMNLISTVRYCSPVDPCPFANAFWNGEQMVFGAGYSSADDMVAHEMTHGVTDYESNLFYYMQSGAINEAFSDIWGEFVDLNYTNGLDDDGPGVRWLLGEDLPGGAVRSMIDPPFYGDPDRMLSPFYYCGTSDNGGVHTNSGVANKAAFLMVEGGPFNGYTVGGIGIEKAAQIWYEVQTNMLTSGADYQDLSDALSQACNNLVGTAGITSYNCQQVREAAAATEMSQQPTSCAAVHAPLCDEYGFNSQFSGTSPGWYAVAELGDWAVDANYLYTDGEPETASSVATYESYGDFDYTARMTRQGCDSCTNGVMIRGAWDPLSPENWWDDGYGFFYSRNGYFSVWKFRSGTYTALQSWTTSEAINTFDAWNTLRVVAEGSNLSFYINGDLVWSGIDRDLAVGQVGLVMYRDLSSTGNLFQVDWATPDGGAPFTLFYDDFEHTLAGNWAWGTMSGSNDWYYPQTFNPYDFNATYGTSGDFNLWGYDQANISDAFIRMRSNVSLPPGDPAYLHFGHAHDFEYSYDGGVIEVSVDGGIWYDAGYLISENGYNGTLSTLYGNPLGGRPAFVGETYGYLSSRLDLSSLAGHDVRFRFRIGTDNSIDNLGWFIDDVRIYTCARSVSRQYLPVVLNPSSPSTFNASFTWAAPNWTIHSGVWGVDSSFLLSPGVQDRWASVSYGQDFSDVDYRVRLMRYGADGSSNRILIRSTPDPLAGDHNLYSYYSFQYARDGSFSVWKRVEGVSTPLQGWTTDPAVNPGDAYNTLRVVANGPDLSFYINGTLVWSGSDADLTSGRVGIGMYRGASDTGDWLYADWATLSSLSSVRSDRVAPQTIPISPIMAGHDHEEGILVP